MKQHGDIIITFLASDVLVAYWIRELGGTKFSICYDRYCSFLHQTRDAVSCEYLVYKYDSIKGMCIRVIA